MLFKKVCYVCVGALRVEKIIKMQMSKYIKMTLVQLFLHHPLGGQNRAKISQFSF